MCRRPFPNRAASNSRSSPFPSSSAPRSSPFGIGFGALQQILFALALHHNMLLAVLRFPQKAGLILLAATWLPFSFFGRVHDRGSSSAGQSDRKTRVEAAYAAHSPLPAIQFHQLRLGGWGCFSKFSDLDSLEPFTSAQNVSGLQGIWFISPAPDNVLNNWQFTRRAALHPRAPCPV